MVGVVDTDMQTDIRNEAKEAGMPDNVLSKFTGLYVSNKLLDPDVPGKKIADLALRDDLPQAFSGQFMSWDDPRLST